MNFESILTTVGTLLVLLSLLMLPPFAVALWLQEQSVDFLIAFFITFFFGALLTLTAKTSSPPQTGQSARQGFATIALSWSAAGLFSALPFLLSIDTISITDAIFEAFSGITTTGSTIFTGLDSMDKSILLWRSSLQWIGGIGFVVMAVIILPALQIGGMQLFQIELFEGMEKDSPRISQIGKNIVILYLTLTALCSLSYFLAGMSFFDAVNHAMTTVATGGYSTHDSSFAYFQSPTIEAIAVFFMIVGSLPFILLIHTLRGKFIGLFRDEQVRLFFFLFFLFLIVLNSYLIFGEPSLTPTHALRLSLFNLTSIFTGTGYASAPFDTWGPTSLALFFFFMFLGGCAGSTSCGIKIFRFQVLGKVLHNHIRSAIQPYGVFIAKYNGRPLTTPIIHSVMSFMACFLLFYVIIAILLAAHGLDFLSALSATTAAIANVGPALGPLVGPDSTFQNLPESAKWLLTIAMLLGRLDIITILVLFSPRFWNP